MLVQNIRDFPEAKLDSGIDASFLLNEHSDPHFSMHEFKLHKVICNIPRPEENFKLLLQKMKRTRLEVHVLGTCTCMCPYSECLSL